MERIRIGTCSWKYDSWVGLVYGEKNKEEYLREYARQFNTVEVDQWFWSLFDRVEPKLPDPAVARAYKEQVPADFTFSVKVPNSITLTHYYSRDKQAPLVDNPNFLSVELFLKFLERLHPLNERLGPLMFQFEYLNKRKMPNQFEFMDRFSEFITQCPGEYDYALEIRNPNYLNHSYFEFLDKNRLHQVFVQGYYMPPVVDIYGKFSQWINDMAIFRLMGPDRKGIEKKTGDRWDQVVDPRDNELLEIVRLGRELKDRGVRVYLNINNHYEGSAPLTIDKIRNMLEDLEA